MNYLVFAVSVIRARYIHGANIAVLGNPNKLETVRVKTKTPSAAGTQGIIEENLIAAGAVKAFHRIWAGTM